MSHREKYTSNLQARIERLESNDIFHLERHLAEDVARDLMRGIDEGAVIRYLMDHTELSPEASGQAVHLIKGVVDKVLDVINNEG